VAILATPARPLCEPFHRPPKKGPPQVALLFAQITRFGELLPISRKRTFGVSFFRWDRHGRKDQPCVVLARGAMNSCLVKFEDGYTMVTSRNALQRHHEHSIPRRKPSPPADSPSASPSAPRSAATH